MISGIDVISIEEFTPDSVKFTNRAYYLTVLHSAFEFLEEISDKEIHQYQKIITERENRKRAIDIHSQFNKPKEVEEQQTRLGTVAIKYDHFKFVEKGEKKP